MSTAGLRNIGPKSAAWLRQVGLHQSEDLVAAGAVQAFLKVRRAGFKPSLNLLYALEGAILGCHWQEIPEARRSELVLAAGEEVAKLPLPKNKRMPAAGPVTTTRSDEDEGAMPEADFGLDDVSGGADGASDASD